MNPSAFGKQRKLYHVHFNYPVREHSSLGESPAIPGRVLFHRGEIQQNKYQPRWEFLKLTKSFLFPQLTQAILYGHDRLISPSFRAEDTEMETWGGGEPFQIEIKTNHFFAY